MSKTANWAGLVQAPSSTRAHAARKVRRVREYRRNDLTQRFTVNINCVTCFRMSPAYGVASRSLFTSDSGTDPVTMMQVGNNGFCLSAECLMFAKCNSFRWWRSWVVIFRICHRPTMHGAVYRVKKPRLNGPKVSDVLPVWRRQAEWVSQKFSLFLLVLMRHAFQMKHNRLANYHSLDIGLYIGKYEICIHDNIHDNMEMSATVDRKLKKVKVLKWVVRRDPATSLLLKNHLQFIFLLKFE